MSSAYSTVDCSLAKVEQRSSLRNKQPATTQLESQFQLRTVVIAQEDRPFCSHLLAELGLQVMAEFRPTEANRIEPLHVQVAIIHSDCVPISQARELAATLRKQQLAIVVLLDSRLSNYRLCLEFEADAYLPAGSDPLAIAMAARNAWSTLQAHLDVQKQVNDLEAKVKGMKLIAHASSIIAEHRGISEADALRELRQESRRRRLAMEDFARALIDIQAVMIGPTPARVAARQSQSPGRKRSSPVLGRTPTGNVNTLPPVRRSSAMVVTASAAPPQVAPPRRPASA